MWMGLQEAWTPMDATFSADEHFREGQSELERDRVDAALEHFRAAHRLDPTSPRYRSYFGLCLGLAERRFDRALELCRSAAKEDLGKVIGKGGAHASAIRTIMAATSGKEKKRYILEIIEN